MRVERELTVAAPMEHAWRELADVEAVAACLPGARLDRIEGEALYTGGMRIPSNGAQLECIGTVAPVDVDDDDHIATVAVRGREAAGPAIGSGLIEGRLMPENGSTRMLLSADISLTGARAPSETLEHAAAEILDGLGSRLEERIVERDRRASDAARATTPPPPRAGDRPDERPVRDRTARGGAMALPAGASAAALAVVILLARAGRRRRAVALSIRYRW